MDLRPGFVRHAGPRSLQLGWRILHLWLALRREKKNTIISTTVAAVLPQQFTKKDLFKAAKIRPQRGSE